MGILYDVSLPTLIGFSVLVQLGAIPLLWLVTRGIGQPSEQRRLNFRLSAPWDHGGSV